MPAIRSPGVYLEEVFPVTPTGLQTGVPAFLGIPQTRQTDGQGTIPVKLTLWAQFEQFFDAAKSSFPSFLPQAVQGFFANGGQLCYVVPLPDMTSHSLEMGLSLIEPLDTIDLVCVPDITGTDIRTSNSLQDVIKLQQKVLDHCDRTGDRIAILDPVVDATPELVLQQGQSLSGTNGTLYFPPLDTGLRDSNHKPIPVPPCGHIAGIYARTDARVGVHKAPANEVLEGVLGLSTALTDIQQGDLNEAGINCLRAFPGRGIRVWGARTLSPAPNWRYVNVRRLFLTAARWIERSLAGIVFELNSPALWASIRRDLTVYLHQLAQQGALRGASPDEAFYVKCDAQTNPPDVQDAGMVVTEIGLAPAVPGEFVVIRIVHSASGVAIAESS